MTSNFAAAAGSAAAPSKTTPNRRQVALGIAASLCLPRPGLANAGFHRDVAARARAIASPGTKLHLLLPDGSEANVRPIIEAFRQEAGIEVRLEAEAVDDINARLILDSFSEQTTYDLALPATFGIPDLAAGGVIRPLTEFAKRHEPEGFRDTILYGAGDQFDGETYGFQTDGDVYLMFYHRDWLNDPDENARYADRYSTPLTVPTTWQELDRQMAYFHRPEQGRFGGALFRTPGYLAWEWWIRLHSKGIWPMSAELEPQIASDEAVEALEEMIRATDSLYPGARTTGLFQNWSEFSKGQIFCNIGWGGTQKFLNSPKSAMRGRLIHAPPPSGIVDGELISLPYFNWGWNYVVTSASRNPELAYLFALFASTSEMSTLAVREADGFFDPFRPEHYDDPVIKRTYSPDFLKVHQASMTAAMPDLYLAHQSEYFAVLQHWLTEAVTGRMRPEKALRRAATQWSMLSLRAGKDVQRRRWIALRDHYPANTKRLLRDLS